jgi:hypothetical protein
VRTACLIAAALLMSAGPVAAQTFTEAEARAALFGTRGTSIAVSGALSATDQQIIRRTIDLLADQLNGPIKYYASIAYSPDDGLVSEALQSAMNYHSAAASDAAALAACNAVKTSGARGCEIAARVLPRGYEARALTLSHDATGAFERAYRRERAPKAMAVSPSTGAFAIARSAEGAIAACRGNGSGAGDCRVVIAD